MKTIKSLLISATFMMLFLKASVVHAQPATSGKILCSVLGKNVQGFDLVKVRKQDKAYQGTCEVQNIRFTGTYTSSSASFKIEASRIDEEGEVQSPLLFAEGNLRAGEFWHSKTQHESGELEIYCYFIADIIN